MPYVEYDEVEAICADCGRTFRSEEALAAHREEAHAGLDTGARPRARVEAPDTMCSSCGRKFDSVVVLQSHVARAHPR